MKTAEGDEPITPKIPRSKKPSITALEVMSDHDLRTIDRARDKALSMVPAFGTIEDKQRAIINSKQALEALEKTLIAASKGAESVAMKGEIASRMTTKEMILAEAKSAKKPQ